MGDDQTSGGGFRERQHGSDSAEVTVLSVDVQVTLEHTFTVTFKVCLKLKFTLSIFCKLVFRSASIQLTTSIQKQVPVLYFVFFDNPFHLDLHHNTKEYI